MSKTTLVVIAVLAGLVAYQMAQPQGRERAQTMFNEVSAWIQARF